MKKLIVTFAMLLVIALLLPSCDALSNLQNSLISTETGADEAPIESEPLFSDEESVGEDTYPDDRPTDESSETKEPMGEENTEKHETPTKPSDKDEEVENDDKAEATTSADTAEATEGRDEEETTAPQKDATYTVEYYLMDPDTESYPETPTQRSQFSGKVGSTVSAQVKSFDGYRYDTRMSTPRGVITEDGTLTLKLYYMLASATGKSATYKSYAGTLGSCWNPHTWESSAEDSILSYISSTLVSMEAKDTVNGVYQWVYEMATSIKDVTAQHQAHLIKYGCVLPEDTFYFDVTEGYVFEIKLNEDAMWQNGDKITADDYIYSMQQLLNPKMRNYRANNYIAGEAAIAGAFEYYNSESPIYADVVPAYTEEGDYSFDIDAAIAAGTLYINVNSEEMTLYPMSLVALNNTYLGDAEIAAQLTKFANEANAYGYTKVTAENKTEIFDMIKFLLVNLFGLTGEAADMYLMEALFYDTGVVGDAVSFDEVGLYKVDDYTIRYVCKTAIDYYYFLTSCTSTWLVHEGLYEAGKYTTAQGAVATTYGTSAETSMSYGVYKIESFTPHGEIVFTQNENWYGWAKGERGEKLRDNEGNLISYTSYHKNIDGEVFLVDGQDIRQHSVARVILYEVYDENVKIQFLKGELSDWGVPTEDLYDYTASDRLYRVDETYTMSFFFNTGIEALQNMDRNKGNTNSVVLSNANFRKAFSLSIDRYTLSLASAGYKPMLGLMNNLYYYDFYNDPSSSYRNSDQAKMALCYLYGVAWGEGTPYATLDEAVDSITGYNPVDAQKLMKAACEELVAAGLYTAGEEIVINIGWAKFSLSNSDYMQVDLINNYINRATEGSGFGRITFVPICNIADRYGDVPKGEYAIGYGAWGGAALYPFRNFLVYMDPDNTAINEAGCWDPTTEELTLTVNGEEVTMTWQAWSNCMIGTGKYADADFDTKLDITAMLEAKYLEKYYRIPLMSTAVCSMLSAQFDYYTEDYNFAYGFGGLRLMQVNYTDAEWAEYVESVGGELDYK